MQTFAAPVAIDRTGSLVQDAPGEAAWDVVDSGGIVTLNTALRMYRRQMGTVLRKGTLYQHGKVVEHFMRHTGPDTEIRVVKPKHLQEWIATMDVQASTIRYRISVMRTFFRWAGEHGHLRHDPMAGVRAPRQPRATPRSVPLPDLAELGKALPDARARCIIALMLHLGLRAGEVAALEMADVDLISNTVRIVGKGGHERILPIPEIVRHFLDPYIRERGRIGGPLIQSQKDPGQGVKAGHISHMVTRWMRDAGIKREAYDGRSAHALRHTTAENLYRHGVDLRTIAAALGHASPTTTWKYLRHHASVEELRDVMGMQIIEEQRPSLRPVPKFTPPPQLEDTA